jgi:predicted DNA-binding transcriptional regulator YafY
VSFDESLWDSISTRNWHRTQKVSRVKDGRFELTAILTNVWEFKPWVLQFGSLATVLEPDWLREEIKAELLSACRNY